MIFGVIHNTCVKIIIIYNDFHNTLAIFAIQIQFFTNHNIRVFCRDNIIFLNKIYCIILLIVLICKRFILPILSVYFNNFALQKLYKISSNVVYHTFWHKQIFLHLHTFDFKFKWGVPCF